MKNDGWGSRETASDIFERGEKAAARLQKMADDRQALIDKNNKGQI
jgi:hypothetical protein